MKRFDIVSVNNGKNILYIIAEIIIFNEAVLLQCTRPRLSLEAGVIWRLVYSLPILFSL